MWTLEDQSDFSHIEANFLFCVNFFFWSEALVHLSYTNKFAKRQIKLWKMCIKHQALKLFLEYQCTKIVKANK